MARPEHLAILKKGLKVWNKWRRENPDTAGWMEGDNPDTPYDRQSTEQAITTGADLVREIVRVTGAGGPQLREADLSGADLRKTNLRGADLCEVNLNGADLRGADLTWADLRHAKLDGADLRNANLFEANLAGLCSARRTCVARICLDQA